MKTKIIMVMLGVGALIALTTPTRTTTNRVLPLEALIPTQPNFHAMADCERDKIGNEPCLVDFGAVDGMVVYRYDGVDTIEY